MTTEIRNRPYPRLATSRADELVYAIALAMARRQMRRNWGNRWPSEMKVLAARPAR